jgi:hypothetical protein
MKAPAFGGELTGENRMRDILHRDNEGNKGKKPKDRKWEAEKRQLRLSAKGGNARNTRKEDGNSHKERKAE